jgi:CBS-domain-containing membrane protein
MGALAAIAAVFLGGTEDAPPVLSANMLTLPRAAAGSIAMLLTLLLQVLARSSHPPAAATTLLIALGGFTLSIKSMLVLLAGVLLVAALGEPLRRWRLSSSGARKSDG